MNALNLLSARIIGSAPPSPTSSGSSGDLKSVRTWPLIQPRRSSRGEAHHESAGYASQASTWKDQDTDKGEENQDDDSGLFSNVDEKSPSLGPGKELDIKDSNRAGWKLIARHLAEALIASVRWMLSTLAAPGVYLVASMYDDTGKFSPLFPARRFGRLILRRQGARSTAQAVGISAALEHDDAVARTDVRTPPRPQRMKSTLQASSWRSAVGSSTSTDATSVAGGAQAQSRSTEKPVEDFVSARTRSKASPPTSSDESTTGAKPSRPRSHNAAGQARRRSRKTCSTGSRGAETSEAPLLTPATIKSPTSPSPLLALPGDLQTPAPPRPLIPRLKNSHSFSHSNVPGRSLKTLILDLDETLIHSLAKGGRMSSGHMVEVKLNVPVGLGGNASLAPQHPILYYVHKRPHCDDFLRKVCKWYNLVIFTASVQEYADPVIDWLEQDRKYFSGRYYRQHCTFRAGNYVKDIRCVEPDLSKVMIVDNSPASYIFHEDNAIPIEGWINDPTDNDLLHLIPLLEGLQYVTDVRALLSLRMGEVTSMISPPPMAL